ncbi:UNKNOWN [Stylonychia lemnae]|uniref:Uncharacterized protein n=1 Tax=Stylonychia lemnae TaxID=5949 RepID=A0A077ZWN9_STYLE|nr:UNKNOWN [Stylonychia lemnae]|eukprot:CDW73707.1 UNKNOWN [Stylonychia lemnae]
MQLDNYNNQNFMRSKLQNIIQKAQNNSIEYSPEQASNQRIIIRKNFQRVRIPPRLDSSVEIFLKESIPNGRNNNNQFTSVESDKNESFAINSPLYKGNQSLYSTQVSRVNANYGGIPTMPKKYQTPNIMQNNHKPSSSQDWVYVKESSPNSRDADQSQYFEKTYQKQDLDRFNPKQTLVYSPQNKIGTPFREQSSNSRSPNPLPHPSYFNVQQSGMMASTLELIKQKQDTLKDKFSNGLLSKLQQQIQDKKLVVKKINFKAKEDIEKEEEENKNQLLRKLTTMKSDNSQQPLRRMNVVRIQTGQQQIIDQKTLNQMSSQKILDDGDDLMSENLISSSDDEKKIKRKQSNDINNLSKLKNPLLKAILQNHNSQKTTPQYAKNSATQIHDENRNTPNISQNQSSIQNTQNRSIKDLLSQNLNTRVQLLKQNKFQELQKDYQIYERKEKVQGMAFERKIHTTLTQRTCYLPLFL